MAETTEELTHQVNVLLEGIHEAAIKAGICRPDISLSGPQALMLLGDMADYIVHLEKLTKLEPAAEDISGLLLRNIMAQSASCNCVTKTPDPAYHAHTCRFRALVEGHTALVALQQLDTIVRKNWRGEYWKGVTNDEATQVKVALNLSNTALHPEE